MENITMQITPVSYNYTTQKTQRNNQQSFGMAATKEMMDFWAANRLRLLTALPPYPTEQMERIMLSMGRIEDHPSTIVDIKGDALIVSKKGQPDKTITIKDLGAIEEAAKEL